MISIIRTILVLSGLCLAFQPTIADDLYLTNGVVVKNVVVLYLQNGASGQLYCFYRFNGNVEQVLDADIVKRNIIVYDANITSSKEIYSDSLYRPKQTISYDLQISTVQGGMYYCNFVESTDSTVIYSTELGNIILRKSDILSAVNRGTQNSINTTKKTTTKKIVIKDYKALPLLFVAVGGAVWSYNLFKESSDLSNASDVFGAMRLYTLQNEAKDDSNNKLALGIGIGALSVIFAGVAFIPTVSSIEQPVSIFPTNNGVAVCIRF